MDITTTIFLSVCIVSATVFFCVAFMGILNAFMKYKEWKLTAEVGNTMAKAAVEMVEQIKEYCEHEDEKFAERMKMSYHPFENE